MVNTRYLAFAHLYLGETMMTTGGPEAALPLYELFCDLANLLYEKESDAGNAEILNVSHLTLAQIKEELADYEGAHHHSLEASNLHRERYDDDPSPENLAALVSSLGNLSFIELKISSFEQAISHAQEAIDLDASQLWVHGNLAHALLLNGEVEKAKEIYLKHKGKRLGAEPDSDTWEDATASDYILLRDLGVTHPAMEEIAQSLKFEFTIEQP